MAGGAPSTTMNTTTNIPESLQGYLPDIFNAQLGAINDRTAQDTQSPYGTIAPWNQAQQTATDMQMGMALNPDPTQNSALNYSQNMLDSGGFNPYGAQSNSYIGMNPYLDATAGKVASSMSNAYETGTRATRDAQAARSGGYGSSGWDAQRQRDETAFGNNLGNTLNNLYSQEYNRSGDLQAQDLTRQTNAYSQGQQNSNQVLSQVPGLQTMLQGNIGQLQNAGDRQYAYQQSLLDSMNNNYQNNNNFGLNQGNLYGNALRNAMGLGGTSTSSSKPASNMGGLLGGLGIAGLASMFG